MGLISKLAGLLGIKSWIVYLVLSLIGTAVVGGIYWRISSWRDTAAKVPGLERDIKNLNKDLKDYKDQYAAINTAIARQEARLQESKKATDLLSESLKYEISKNPVYRQCIIPAEWMRLRNQAIAARNAR